MNPVFSQKRQVTEREYVKKPRTSDPCEMNDQVGDGVISNKSELIYFRFLPLTRKYKHKSNAQLTYNLTSCLNFIRILIESLKKKVTKRYSKFYEW